MVGKPQYNYCTEWLVTRNVCMPAYITYRFRIGDPLPYNRAMVELEGYHFVNSHSNGNIAWHTFRADTVPDGMFVQAETPDEAWETYDFMYPFNF